MERFFWSKKYHAFFEARAIIDFKEIPENPISINGTIVSINRLPEPVIKAKLDTAKSRIIHEDRQVLSNFAHDLHLNLSCKPRQKKGNCLDQARR